MEFLEPRALLHGESPQIFGHWDAPVDSQVVAVHAHVLPTGRVLYWEGDDGEGDGSGPSGLAPPRLFDPATGEISSVEEIPWNAFCAGHAFLSDGRLLVTGGHVGGHVGMASAGTFDAASGEWQVLPPMNAGRWYPTHTALPNGDMLVVSGEITRGNVNRLPQVFEAATNTWRDLDTARYPMHLYPFMFVTPDGMVFNAGPNRDTRMLDPRGSGDWSDMIAETSTFRTDGSAVMYDDGQVLVLGGADGDSPPTATAEVIDLNDDRPNWRLVEPMEFGRKYANATILPDGTVLVTGGTSTGGFNRADEPVFAAELWNPETETWTTLATNHEERIYHSVALLLPDGRVWVGGGGQPGANGGGHHLADKLNYEIFSPPYLFDDNGQPITEQNRPRITAAPEAVGYGETFFVGTPDSDIVQATWIRLPSVTHAFNQNQRINRLDFAATAGGLQIAAPDDPNLAPPGHYMLFLIDAAGTPSIAKIVQIADREIPQQPLPTKTGESFSIKTFDYDVTTAEFSRNDLGGNLGVLHNPPPSATNPAITNVQFATLSNGSRGGSLQVGFNFQGQPMDALGGIFETLAGHGAAPGRSLDTRNLFGDFLPWQNRSADRLVFDVRLETAEPVKLKVELKDASGFDAFTRVDLTPAAGGPWQTIELAMPAAFTRSVRGGNNAAGFDWRQVSTLSLLIERTHLGDGVFNPPTGTFLLDNLRLVDSDGLYPDLAAIESPVGDRIDRKYERAFLEHIRALSSVYFLDAASPAAGSGGIIQDRATFPDLLTVGGAGFQLTSYVIDAETGQLSRAAAAERVREMLRTLHDKPQGPQATGTIGHEGFFYHFLGTDGLRKRNPDFPETPTDESQNTIELSTIDTALAIAGAVTAGQYFHANNATEAEIRQLSQALYSRVNWRFMLNSAPGPDSHRPQTNQFFLGWKPNENRSGPAFDIPDANNQGGYSGTPGRPLTLDYYTDEALLVALLAMGSPNPDHRVGREVWDAILREDRGDRFIQTFPGSLFTFQFFGLFANTRQLGTDNHPDQPIEFFENTRAATRAAIDYARRNSEGIDTLSHGHWGVSAAEGPFGIYRDEGLPTTSLASPRTERIEGEINTLRNPLPGCQDEPGGNTRCRGRASQEHTVWLRGGESVTLPLRTFADATYEVRVRYSNDGPGLPADTVQISIDGVIIGPTFDATNTRVPGDFAGAGWNTFNTTDLLGLASLSPGDHAVTISAVSTDFYGLEIDYVELIPVAGSVRRATGIATNYAVAAAVPVLPLPAINELYRNAALVDINGDGRRGDLLHPRFGLADAFTRDIADAPEAPGTDKLRASGAWLNPTGFAISHGPTVLGLTNYLDDNLVPELFMSHLGIQAALDQVFGAEPQPNSGRAFRDGQDGQNTPSPHDEFDAVVFDVANNQIAVGARFGFGDAGNNPSDTDVLVTKLDPQGSQQWAYVVGSPDDEGDNSGDDADRAQDVAVDAAGNIYVIGSFRNTIDFDPHHTYPGDADIITNAGSFDVFLLKLDANGHFLWALPIGGPSGFWELGAGIDVDSFGNVYVTGRFGSLAGGSVDFDPRHSYPDNRDLQQASRADAFVAKYDADANLAWVRVFAGNDELYASAVHVGRDGKIYAAGTFRGTADFDRSHSHVDNRDILQVVSPSAFNSDTYLVKLDSDGTFLWARAVGGAGWQQLVDIAADALGNVYGTGLFQSTVDFDPGGGTTTIDSNNGSFDVFVLKLDSAGEFVWVRTAGSYRDDRGLAISLTPGGQVLVAGQFGATVDFDPGTPQTLLASVANSTDGFLWALNARGEFDYVRQFGGAETDVAQSVAVGGDDRIGVAGYFAGTAEFSFGDTSASLTSSGGYDGFLLTLLTSAPANAAPRALAFARQSPLTSPTNANTLVFRVTFSEAVFDVDPADFAASGTTAVLSVVMVGPAIYDVTLSSGDLADLTGTVGLNLAASPAISDSVGASLVNAEPGTDETYSLDNTPPEVRIVPSRTYDTTPAIMGTVSDGTLSVMVNGKTYTAGDGNLTVTGTNWTLQIPNTDALAVGAYSVLASASDAAGNVGSDGKGNELTIEAVPPGGDSVEASVRFTDADGNSLPAGDGLTIGQPFRIYVFAQDLRTSGADKGVLSFFSDLNFNTALIDVTRIVPLFNDFTTGTIGEAAGLVEEVGGLENSQPSNRDPQAVFYLEATAVAAGLLQVTTDAGDEAVSEITLFGLDGDQRPHTRFGSAEITIGQPDLVGTVFDAVPDHVLGGQTAVNIEVKNQGESGAAAFDARFVLSADAIIGNADDLTITTVSFSGLAAGASSGRTVMLDLPRATLYAASLLADPRVPGVNNSSNDVAWLGLIVDPANAIAESNEANNLDRGKGLDKDDVTYFPWDVNGNGSVGPTDVVSLINRLGQQSPPLEAKFDLNGDGRVTPTEVVATINRLGYLRNATVIEAASGGASGAAADSSPVYGPQRDSSAAATGEGEDDSLIDLTISFTDTVGRSIRRVAPGESFRIIVSAQDLRTDGGDAGVVSAFADLVYDTELADVTSIVPLFDDFPTGTIDDVAGVVDEVGGLENSLPADRSPQPVFYLEAIAIEAGLLTVASVAGSSPFSENTLLGLDGDLRGQTRYGEASLLIAVNTAPWHNIRDPFDVDDDGDVFAQDAGQLVNYLNAHGIGRLPAPQLGVSAPPPFVDVSGDGILSALDVALLVNRLNLDAVIPPPAAGSDRGEAEAAADTIFRELAANDCV